MLSLERGRNPRLQAALHLDAAQVHTQVHQGLCNLRLNARQHHRRTAHRRAAVDDALAGVADLAWRTWRVQVVCDVPADLMARADATRLGQIVRNLVLNALRRTSSSCVAGVNSHRMAARLRLCKGLISS
jgi:signal transduction histidine kinase